MKVRIPTADLSNSTFMPIYLHLPHNILGIFLLHLLHSSNNSFLFFSTLDNANSSSLSVTLAENLQRWPKKLPLIRKEKKQNREDLREKLKGWVVRRKYANLLLSFQETVLGKIRKQSNQRCSSFPSSWPRV